MREGWPSLTAAIVAVGRGIGLSDRSRDRFAPELLPPPLARAVRSIAGSGVVRGAARVALLGLVDHVCLRMTAIDRVVEASVAEGTRQLVILGAGLDGRAYRMESLTDVDVYEVDHPATQSYKRQRVEGRLPLSRRHRLVEVDFESDTSLVDALAAAGHDGSSPTTWIWEGVVMYLQPEAIDQSLSDIASRSSPGSTLVVSYATTDNLPLGSSLVGAAFSVLGEPLVGMMDADEIGRRLDRAGFSVEADTASDDWARDAGEKGRLSITFRGERLVVARYAPD